MFGKLRDFYSYRAGCIAAALLLAACSSGSDARGLDPCDTLDADVETELQRLIDEYAINRFWDVIEARGIELDEEVTRALEDEDIVGLLPAESLPALLPLGTLELPRELFEPVKTNALAFETDFESWLEAGLFDPSDPAEVEAARAYLFDQMDSDGSCESPVREGLALGDTGDDKDECEPRDCDECTNCSVSVRLVAVATVARAGKKRKGHGAWCKGFYDDGWRYKFNGSKASWSATGGWANTLGLPEAWGGECSRSADKKHSGTHGIDAYARARYSPECPEDLKAIGSLYPEAAHSVALRATATRGGGGKTIIGNWPWYAEATGGANCAVSPDVEIGMLGTVKHRPKCQEKAAGKFTVGWSEKNGYSGEAGINSETICTVTMGIPTTATPHCLISRGRSVKFCGKQSVGDVYAKIGGHPFAAEAKSVDNYPGGGWITWGARGSASARTIGGTAKVHLAQCKTNYPCIECRSAGSASIGPTY